MSVETKPSWMLPLEGTTAAPSAARQLADLGARVAKVERPGDFARSYDGTVSGMAGDERFGPILPGARLRGRGGLGPDGCTERNVGATDMGTATVALRPAGYVKAR